MPDKVIEKSISQDYKYGFSTDIQQDTLAPGLDEEVIRTLSKIKDEPDWLLEWRLKAYRHWLTMTEPDWAEFPYPKIDYQDLYYYAAPKQKKKELKSMDEVDPEMKRTFEKLGIPLIEQKRLAGVAVDAIFDSVSVVYSSFYSRRTFYFESQWKER